MSHSSPKQLHWEHSPHRIYAIDLSATRGICHRGGFRDTPFSLPAVPLWPLGSTSSSRAVTSGSEWIYRCPFFLQTSARKPPSPLVLRGRDVARPPPLHNWLYQYSHGLVTCGVRQNRQLMLWVLLVRMGRGSPLFVRGV